MITYNLVADGNYVSKVGRKKVGLHILRQSTTRVGIVNGCTSSGKFVTQFPFLQLSKQAAETDIFQEFPTSSTSAGKIADDCNISIFTKDGVTVHKEHDVLITCKGAPTLIGKHDERGRYHIPLIQQRGQWQMRKPTKKSRKFPRKSASIICNLLFKE